jgi:glutamate N-acetyltransferase/amino-acid N-acetyltransferase
MTPTVPQGFRLAGVHCGLKRNPQKQDIALIVADQPSIAAGVYTQNLVFAAPVALDRERTPSESIRTIVINSGNANACTGEQGLQDAREMARLAAEACGGDESQALVLSTGIIGQHLPMDRIAVGIADAATQLAGDEESLITAARGMMTTDTGPKLSGRTLKLSVGAVQVTGMAKGAAMIGPNMATMLGVILTDAKLDASTAQQLLSAAVGESFNCIAVEGHMSTNDTVLMLASGVVGEDVLVGDDLKKFAEAVHEVSLDLAKAIIDDGEGATHTIVIEVCGTDTRDSARQIAKTVAESVLVKTAITGADPNWGRIVSAAGYAGVPFDPAGVELTINDHLLYQHGTPVEFDEPTVSESIRSQRQVQIVLRFSEGDAMARFWTTDLTAEYVRLNADYHT